MSEEVNKEEEADKPFFKKLKFWVHVIATTGFLFYGQYRAYQKEHPADAPVHAEKPVTTPVTPLPDNSPTLWSLQVQATNNSDLIRGEIADRKALNAMVEEYRRENHADLVSLAAEVRGLRSDMKELLELQHSRPKNVSFNQ